MEKMNKTEEMLANVPLFAGLHGNDLRRISSLMTRTNVPEGTVLAREGQHGNDFMIVLSGTASVTCDGQEIASIGPGEYIGEISIIDGGPRTATVVATSSMELEVASHQEFVSLLDQAPEIARNMLPTLVRRLREGRTRHTD